MRRIAAMFYDCLLIDKKKYSLHDHLSKTRLIVRNN